MTPGARVAAAIEILDDILRGEPAERALTAWARHSRFAGSKDRAAVRDHVFDVLRRKRSCAAQGGAMTGRGLMLGLLRQSDVDPATLFTGVGHAPEPLNDMDGTGHAPKAPEDAFDIPAWLWPHVQESLGDNASRVAEALRSRAPVHLRVNLAKTSRVAVQRDLADDGIFTDPHASADTALEITEGARALRNSRAYQTGLVELQDGASQAVVAALPLSPDIVVLDYCAGGGGKALAIAARGVTNVTAHDIAPARMRDLPDRARRAGVAIKIAPPKRVSGLYDVVLCDAPCSGSGAWRRDPDGKWRLTQARLDELTRIQAEILDRAKELVSPNGMLAYATCSLFDRENSAQIDAFLKRNPAWQCHFRHSWTPLDGTDGFYTAHLTRV
ncbi:MAG: RsmB/NOP family class I SAM-dependent RNA methyltransferase [Pseudomonadota bacterium]